MGLGRGGEKPRIVYYSLGGRVVCEQHIGRRAVVLLCVIERRKERTPFGTVMIVVVIIFLFLSSFSP